ncbi:MAG TPA: Lrp/AsnC family transcriptional regulator [Caulobacteraceae bacterium]
MDDLDHRLIALLREDARAPVAGLAKTLKVSRGTVQARIERMQARGDIAGFTVRVRPEAEAQRVRAVMMIAVEGERSAPVVKALSALPQVAAVHTTNGRWDLVADLDTDSLPSFSATLDAIRLIDGIASTETSLLLSTRRF